MTISSLFLLQAQGAPQTPGWWWPFSIALMIGIFYLFIIRPQRQQQDAHRKLVESLQKGDQVVTSGGVVGEVIFLKENEVTIKSGESRLVVLRANVTSIAKRSAEAKSA